MDKNENDFLLPQPDNYSMPSTLERGKRTEESFHFHASFNSLRALTNLGFSIR